MHERKGAKRAARSVGGRRRDFRLNDDFDWRRCAAGGWSGEVVIDVMIAGKGGECELLLWSGRARVVGLNGGLGVCARSVVDGYAVLCCSAAAVCGTPSSQSSQGRKRQSHQLGPPQNLVSGDEHVKFMRASLSSSSFLQPRPPTQIIVFAARLSSRHSGAGDSDGPVESDLPLLKPSLRG